MTREELTERGYDSVVVLDPEWLDEAIIGVSNNDRVVYSYRKLVEAFMEHDEMTYEEAIEWVEYNTMRALPYIEMAPVINIELD